MNFMCWLILCTVGGHPKRCFYRRSYRRRGVCKVHLQLLTAEWRFNHKFSNKRIKAHFRK